ncbi:uncharacterized protein PAC_17735 [Phialocephala subalpina]|uniref:CorA-like transporter domain-containing protein n=1 Tax=Phialocephala subalpina TaxID=576137 RepID=A0A1L7XS05_9HELO|nr:uncharacterized protein PAC_17735 [Phialocephala subalpina]
MSVTRATEYWPSDDRDFIETRFQESTARLFKATGDSQLELIQLSETNLPGNVFTCVVAPPKGSRLIAQYQAQCIVRQEYTWGRFLVTSSVFRAVLLACETFLPYLDFVNAFGFRKSDDDKNYSRYCWRAATSNNNDGEFKLLTQETSNFKRAAEFCYNVRYIDRNGRTNGDPWSLRRIGVYEQQFDGGRSKWIILQPSSQVHRRLLEYFQLPVERIEQKAGNTPLHVTIMVASSRHWGEYIDSLRQQLNEIDVKARLCSVGKRCNVDYSITFADCQRMHSLRKKLLRAQAALNSNIKIARGCELRCKYLQRLCQVPPPTAALADLQAHTADLRTYNEAIALLVKDIDSSAILLGRILDFRNHEAMYEQEQALRHIALASKIENENMAKLTRQAAQDSKFIKALTMLATMYLPATLIATIFSSNLVESQKLNEAYEKSHLVATQDFWVYVVFVLPLTILTMVLIFWLSRRSARHV